MTRQRLANRRPCERIAFEHDGQNCTAVIGFRTTPDGEYLIGGPAEIFIEGGKPGSAFAAACRDGGLVLSIAMQHGVPLKVFQLSMTRLDDGSPAGVIGAAIDIIMEAYGGSA